MAREETGTGVIFSEMIETGAQSSNSVEMIAEALRQAQLEREQIECLAIGLGPGSYHGIRAAIALAQGWQLARPIKLVGISSVECLAAQAQAEGIKGRVHIVIDAQREEFYSASYEISAEGRVEIEPLRLTAMAEVQEKSRPGEVTLGPEVSKWFAGGRIVFPRAAALGQLAMNRKGFLAGEALEPIYLRETKFVKAPPARILPL